MTTSSITPDHAALDRALAGLPARHPGPGGAVAVLRDGAVLARHAWGWADAERRIAFTPSSLFRVCSITKQFTCALLLDQCADPAMLAPDLARVMPALAEPAPGILDLAHNQSGLRDYWATAMLCGAAVEGAFGPADAARLIARTRSLHFAPGTAYSYANQNFRILGDLVAHRAGEDFAALLRRRILAPAGLPTAHVAADTADAIGTLGYEGSVDSGFRPAVNNIVWTGDAGLAASLDDMIAWETFIDATRDDPSGLYNRLAAPVQFRNGDPAGYGFGLARATLFGRAATCHGGGLRGWRSFRCHIAAERLSVVVLFNHMADPRAATLDLLAAILAEPVANPVPADGPTWDGRFIAPESGLAVRLETLPDRRLRLHYATGPDILTPVAADRATGGGVVLAREPAGLRMTRMPDHQSSILLPCDGTPEPDIEGVFHCAELAATFTCAAAGGTLYGAFSGALGQGAMQALIPFAPDVWLLPCPRALDYAAPGDWTLSCRRDAAGKIAAIEIGCWLARHVTFLRG